MYVCRISVGSSVINFVDGWYIVSAKRFKISVHRVCVRFFQCFNSLYANCHNSSEPVLQTWLILNASHLLYGSEVVMELSQIRIRRMRIQLFNSGRIQIRMRIYI